MDGNVERVVARLFEVETPLPAAKAELTDLAARLTPDTRPGDHAQAMMDLGATICTPAKPACGICPLVQPCGARRAGTAAGLPRKSPKPPKPIRLGYAYVARRSDGALLLERRPPKGLLGGMLGWPGSDWGESPVETPPLDADWQDVSEEVRHTFTHFHLRLSLRIATVSDDVAADRGVFMDKHAFRPASLPTLMRKVWDLADKTHLPVQTIDLSGPKLREPVALKIRTSFRGSPENYYRKGGLRGYS